MPVYNYRCTVCGAEFDTFKKLEEFTRFLPCKCIGMAKLQVQAVQGEVWHPYFDKMQRRTFKTKAEFRKYCSENGCHQVTSKEAKLAREEASYNASLVNKKAKGERSE